MVHNHADSKRQEIQQIIQDIMEKSANGGYNNRTKKNGSWIVRWVAPVAGIFFLALASTGVWVYSSLTTVIADQKRMEISSVDTDERLDKVEAQQAGFKEAIKGVKKDQQRVQRAIESLLNKHTVVSVVGN